MDISKKDLLATLVRPGYDEAMLERAASQFLDDCSDYPELTDLPETLSYILIANALEAAFSPNSRGGFNA